ncbi:MAG: hypothetical protein IJO41_00270 [Oscillospiraceae bacterium]|nr:hypothetical protein [Oscillospiraceae bacterium]
MTRRLIAIRWSFIGAATLILLLLQSQVLGRISIWGVCPVIVPCMAAVAATREPPQHAVVFALVLGMVADTLFTAPLVCFYVLVCVVVTVLSMLVARHLIMPSFRCSVVCCLMALLLSGMLSAVLLLHKGAPLNTVLGLMMRETVVSLPLALVLIHPAFAYFNRITDPR